MNNRKFENLPLPLALLVIALGVSLVGCGPSDPHFEECYAVRMAVIARDVQRVRAQLEDARHVDVNCRKVDEAPTLLAYAAGINSPEIVGLLLEKGANPDLAADGYTPLLLASGDGYSEIAKLLLEHGANVNAEDPEYGYSPLAMAVTRKRASLVRLLLRHGADREHRVRDGRSIEQLALDYGGPDVLRALNP